MWLVRFDAETVQIILQREWGKLEQTAQLCQAAAGVLLQHWLACLPEGARGTDLLAGTTHGRLRAALEADVVLLGQMRDAAKFLGRALLWLHEQEVMRLNKGLAVFRPAMTIMLDRQAGSFRKADFAPLQQHYEQQVVQIHVMAGYVQRGLSRMADAVQLARDYFQLQREQFMARWLPGKESQLQRQTTPESWQKIVTALGNREQQRIVVDERSGVNALVLAGPGAGKTRVLVHRIAYLLWVMRENPQAILVLCYNRHAALEIRQRLHQLVGEDARGVLVLTCHALAMRLLGASFVASAAGAYGSRGSKTGRSGAAAPDGAAFDRIMEKALARVRDEGLPPDDADLQRGCASTGAGLILETGGFTGRIWRGHESGCGIMRYFVARQ